MDGPLIPPPLTGWAALAGPPRFAAQRTLLNPGGADEPDYDEQVGTILELLSDLVADRLATRFVGSPATMVEQLAVLSRVTGADELLITSTTQDHVARVRAHELLIDAWGRARR